MTGSFESVQWNACVHRLDLSLCSHPKEFFRNGVRTSVISKGKIPFTRGTEEGQTSTTASRRTASPTLPAELFQPGMGIGHGSADFLWKRKMSAPKHQTVGSNQNVMVLHQVKNWQNWKMQGCFMQFLRLIFVKKLQLCPLTPTRGLLQPPDPHFSADFSLLNSHACPALSPYQVLDILAGRHLNAPPILQQWLEQ